MSSNNPPTAYPPPLLLPAGCVLPHIDAMSCTGGIDDALFDEDNEAICAIAETSNQSAWLNDDELPEDENSLEGQADKIDPHQPHKVENQPTNQQTKHQCRQWLSVSLEKRRMCQLLSTLWHKRTNRRQKEQRNAGKVMSQGCN